MRVPGKTAGPILRGAARSRTLQEGPNMCCGLAVSPGKPRVPLCEERPGAAHSRRRVPYCEERPGAAHSRRDQLRVEVNGEPRKTTTVNGTVPLEPLYMGQVGSIRGVVPTFLHDMSLNCPLLWTRPCSTTRTTPSRSLHTSRFLRISLLNSTRHG